MQRSSGVTVEECADTVDFVIGKAEQLFASPAAEQQSRTRQRCAISFHARKHTRQPLWVASVRTLASSVLSWPARAHGAKISCGSHLSENITGLICDSLESSVTDINQRICPTVAQTCVNVSSEECEDALPNC